MKQDPKTIPAPQADEIAPVDGTPFDDGVGFDDDTGFDDDVESEA